MKAIKFATMVLVLIAGVASAQGTAKKDTTKKAAPPAKTAAAPAKDAKVEQAGGTKKAEAPAKKADAPRKEADRGAAKTKDTTAKKPAAPPAKKP